MSPTISSHSLEFQKLQTFAFELGFDHLSVAAPIISEKNRDAFQKWRDLGYAKDMGYMSRDPQIREDPHKIYSAARSVLTLGVSYYQGAVPPKPGPAFGRVARYAWGLDYHDVILDRLKKFLTHLPEILGRELHGVLAVDTKPILERALAESAGLGFIGKNTMMIIPRRPGSSSLSFHMGSFVFLAEILLDVDLMESQRPLEKTDVEPDSSDPKKISSVPFGCGSCTKCLTACPTNAFPGPHQLDSGRCIAYLTIENKGWIDRSLRPLMGDWLFGCDVCQDICPFNARAFETRWPEFKPQNGVGAWASLVEILSIKNEKEFQIRFGPTPLSRPKRKGLIRNACVVGGNFMDENLIPWLEPLLGDQESLVRGHALWALSRLMSSEKIRAVADRHLKIDEDSMVQEECRFILEN